MIILGQRVRIPYKITLSHKDRENGEIMTRLPSIFVPIRGRRFLFHSRLKMNKNDGKFLMLFF